MPEVGQVIGGKYRLERLLGEGGMGVVFEAVHLRTGGRVAVKLLDAEVSRRDTAVERFELEARAACAIGHEGIVDVHDMGVDEVSGHYLVMEYLRGETLRDRLARERRLAPGLAAAIACRILAALDAAHGAGIVHRDLKPENVFLVETDAVLPRVKLLDFGISRVTEPAILGTTGPRLTVDGAVLGTPEYMSPEQARGATDVDPRADLFAVGAILYEALVGATPFAGASYNAILARILTEEPLSPARLRPDLPDGLVAAVCRALAKDRERRFRSAADMREALVAFSEGDEPSRLSRLSPPEGLALPGPKTMMTWERGRRSTPGSLRRPRVLALGLGVLGLAALLAGGAALLLDRGAAEATPAAAPAGPAKAQAGRPLAAAPTPEVAEVTLLGLPEGARTFLDGVEVAQLPLRLPLGGPSRELRVEAAGHEPYRVVVTPTADQTVEVDLRPVAVAESSTPSPEGAARAATGGSSAPPAEAASEGERGGGRAASRRRRPSRDRRREPAYRPVEW